MNERYMISVGDDAWRVVCIDEGGKVMSRVTDARQASDDAKVGGIAADNGIAAAVESAKRLLIEMGYDDQSIVLAVASSWCLCARIDGREIRRGERAISIGYCLEEHVPMSAEQMIADCIMLDADEALGVCAEYEKLRVIVEALRVSGVSVQHICPEGLLAAGYVADRMPGVEGLLCHDAQTRQYDWIEFEQGKPATWNWLADDDGAVARLIEQRASARDRRLELVVLGDISAGISADLHKYADVKTMAEMDVAQVAALHAARVIDEQVSPLIDFRTDRLAAPEQYERYRRPMSLLAGAMSMLLICIIGVAQWRAFRYEQQRVMCEAQQVDVFKQAMPGRRVPISVLGRLQSEHRKLAGLGGESADLSVQIPSALVQLQQVLEPLPVDMPFRLLDVSVEPDLIRIDGQAADHGQAEQVASALRQAGVFDVDPPKTQLMKDAGVSFMFTAKPRHATDEKGGTP